MEATNNFSKMVFRPWDAQQQQNQGGEGNNVGQNIGAANEDNQGNFFRLGDNYDGELSEGNDQQANQNDGHHEDLRSGRIMIGNKIFGQPNA